MDPNATWELLVCAVQEKDFEVAEEACDNLVRWVGRGGFAPEGFTCDEFLDLLEVVIAPLLSRCIERSKS